MLRSILTLEHRHLTNHSPSGKAKEELVLSIGSTDIFAGLRELCCRAQPHGTARPAAEWSGDKCMRAGGTSGGL